MILQCPEERFVALLRSVYGRACHNAVKRHSTVPPVPPTAARARNYVTNCTRHSYAGRRQLYSAVSGTRYFATSERLRATDQPSENKPRQIAVLGGGITGLTAAHYLARHATNAHITIYEASDRLGGWIDGERREILPGGSGEVLMQRGPRMLRSGATSNKYDDLVLYDVLANLKLQDKVIHPEAAAGTRYIYYPDHLVRLPKEEFSAENLIEAIRSFLTEPLWTGCVKGGWQIYSNTPRQPMAIEMRRSDIDYRTVFEKDESVAEVLGRMMGDKDAPPIKNIVSAMLHGIYGGDVFKLSAKHTVFDRLWLQNTLPSHEGMLWFPRKDTYLLYDMMDGPNSNEVIIMAEKGVDEKLLAFEDGLVTLVDSLAADLKGRDNVTINTETYVSALEHKNGQIEISTANGTTQMFDQVLSTLFSGHLAQIAQPADSLPSLAATEAVSIQVVNLWYPNPDLLKENPGFGYLIPQSVPSEENPECALGVLFDSDIATSGEEPQGTKLTVMLGGHYWKDWSILPSEEEATTMALAVVERHLGISAEEEVITSAKLCRDCIPQHNVGHRDLMRKAHYELSSTFQGKLAVAGPSYTTVGVIPSMRAGFDAAMRIARGHGQPWFRRPDDKKSMWKWFLQQAEELKRHDSRVQINVGDHVGTTGLEWASENLAPQMWEVSKEKLWFRKWTSDEERFFDAEGNWRKHPRNVVETPGEKEVEDEENQKRD